MNVMHFCNINQGPSYLVHMVIKIHEHEHYKLLNKAEFVAEHLH